TENGSATQITVEATKEGKAPSKEATVTAKAAAKGVTEQHEDKTAPANPTITPYMEGFGGAKITLPTPQSGELLEVKVTVTPKAENGQDTQPAKEVTLTYNGTTWSLPNNDNSNLGLTLKKDGDKDVVILSGDKVPYGGTIAATTTDFAGNKPEAVTQNLNKGPTDETAKEPDYSKDRTDVPTIKAGRTEGTGTNGDQPNAGDIVAKPGGDNDRMVVKFIDKDGQPKEIAIKKDLDQGKWVVDDTATLSNGAQKADRSDYILQDDGTVIVKGPQVQDGSEAEAVGYKTVNGQEKASTAPYVDGKNSDGTWKQESELIKDSVTNQPLTRETKAIITTHKDDATPTQTDKPTVSKGDANTLEKGSAKIKPGQDNTEVVVNFKGYARTVTETPNSATGTGQTQPTERKIITTQSTQADSNADLIYAGAQNTFATEEVDAVLVARKENGEWKLYSATKEDYEHKEQGDDGQQHPSPRNLSPVSDDVATIDKDGNIVLKAAAVKDNSRVSATGFNAMKQPTQGATDTDNITVDPGLTADEVKNKTVDVPTIQQLNDGSVVAKPGQDNKEMTVTYTAPNGEQKTIKVKETTISDSNAPEGSTKWVVEGQNPDNLEVNPTTGAITIPKDKVKVDEKVNATGKDEQNNEAKAEELTVKADATPESAEAAKVTTEGDKVVSEPGGDSKTQTANEVDPNTGEKTPIVVAEKGEDGTWKLADNDPNKANTSAVTDNGSTITINKGDGKTITIDKNTGKITIDPGVVSDGKSISTETTDASGNTTSSGEPIVPPEKEESRETADQPIITLLDNGENKGGVQIQPGDDNTTFTVRYVKEPETTDGNTNTDATAATQREPDSTLTAVKDQQTGTWSLSKDSQGKDIPSDIAEIDPASGTITLKAKAVMDGSKVKAEGQDILGNKKDATEQKAPSNPDVVSQPEPTDELEPEAPPAPPKPKYTPDTVTTADVPETPTIFKNTGTIGQVEITPGAGVDFISFTATINGQVQNIAFIKDGDGWEKYVIRQGDDNKNGKLDGNEEVFYDKVEPVNGNTFTISNITSDKLTDILVGEVGDEYLKPFARPADDANDWVVKGGVESEKAHSFKVKQDPKVAVPERMDVLSDGGKLEAPTIQPIVHDGKYALKITADPDTIRLISFDVQIPENGDYTFFIASQNGKWVPQNFGDYFHKYVLASSDANPDVFYIRDSTNPAKALYINDSGQYAQDEEFVKEIVYGSRENLQNTKIDDSYSITDNIWHGVNDSKRIKLTNVLIGESTAKEEPIGNTGGDTAQPQPTPPAPPPAPAPAPAPKEVFDTPVAKIDNTHGKGGVKVAPRDESSSGEPNTKAFRVDYQQPDGTNKSIWFKRGDDNHWKLDETKFNQQNGLSQLPNNIILNSSTGAVTFKPDAVKDNSKVYITALGSDGKAYKRADVSAEVEPQPVKPTAQHDTEHRGGVIVQPQANTNKFKLTYIDEQNKRRELTYEKYSNTQKWKLSDSDATKLNGVSENLKPKLNDTDGKITLAPDAVRDNSLVKIESYNNEDRITQSADVTTTTD
ncbi:hypothetical protein Q7533_11165, partial [Glaesserella parasuis]|nr:hypothetical protein [Glaesserella parasuis]